MIPYDLLGNPGLNFLACSFAEEQKAVTVNNVNIDPALLLEHEKLMNGARLAIERITNQRMSLLRKRQTNETDSDAGSARSKGEGEEEHDDGQYHHHEHDDHHDHDHGKWDIRHSVPGEPTVDYPVYAAVPSTMFTCTGLPQGYYADKEARCQVFHVCSTPPLIVKSSFLCPNGSIFSQEHLVCEWWNMVNCTGERGSEILAESDLGNKNIANDSMTIIQSFTDDLSLNSNKEQNKVIETDPGDSVMDLEDNGGAGILAITDDSSLNINSNKTVIVSSSLNDSSLYYEEKKKNMIEAAKEVDNSNIPDNNKNQIVPSVDDSGYTYEDAAQKNVSFSLDDSSTYNKFENKSKVTTSNQDESGFSLENVKTKGYAYETPENPLTYPTVTTPSSTTPDFYLDFDLEPRKSDGDSAITTFDSNVKNPLDGIRTNLNNQQITSINEGLYNAFSPSTPAPGYDYSRPLVSTFSPSSPNPTLGYSYSTPSTPFPYPNEINQLNDVKTPAISTFSPSSPNPTFGYSYSSPSTPFSYPNEIKQSNDLKTRYQEDTRYTTAKFPSSTVYPDTFKTQTPADFPSTTLSPPTFNENSGVTFGFTETSLPKFETTPSPIPESDSNTGVSQKVFTGTNSADEKLNFNSLSVSNDGGSGLINVGSTVQTPPSTPAVASVAPSQSSSTGFSNTETGSVQQSSTPPFRGFSGEPFSIKSTTDFPFDNQDLVSQVSQTFEDENGTVVTRVDFKFASENRTTSEETTNTFENKTVTRVITLPSSDLPTDDFLNELNSLSQSELRVEPSSIEFESSSNPNFVPSSQSSSNPNFIQISKDDTETSRQSSARFSTAKPVTTAFRDDDEEPQSPSKLLIPLSNYEEQSSIETSKNSIPDVQEFASLEKYRVKTKTQNSKNIAYYPNKPELNNNFQTQNFQSSQVAITQRTPSYDLKFNNAYVNQPVAYQSAVPINYQPSQNSQYQNQQQINLNLLEYILRTSVPQQNFSPQQNYYPQQSYYPQQGYYTQQNYYPQQTYHSQQALFNPYLEQVRSLLSSGVVNNLDLTKMNYNSGQNLNTLFTSANNQAQRYVVPQQPNKFEQRSFQADIVPSVSFDFDSNEGIRQFNRATSTGLVRRKKRDT